MYFTSLLFSARQWSVAIWCKIFKKYWEELFWSPVIQGIGWFFCHSMLWEIERCQVLMGDLDVWFKLKSPVNENICVYFYGQRNALQMLYSNEKWRIVKSITLSNTTYNECTAKKHYWIRDDGMACAECTAGFPLFNYFLLGKNFCNH